MWDNDEFVFGMKVYLPTEENQTEMIEVIKKAG